MTKVRIEDDEPTVVVEKAPPVVIEKPVVIKEEKIVEVEKEPKPVVVTTVEE